MAEEFTWTIGAGGFRGEVSLLAPTDEALLWWQRPGFPLLYLTDLYVHPLRRRAGWARVLLDAAVAHADAAGADLWTWCHSHGVRQLSNGQKVSRPDNRALEALYKQYGFVTQVEHPQIEMVRRWQAPKQLLSGPRPTGRTASWAFQTLSSPLPRPAGLTEFISFGTTEEDPSLSSGKHQEKKRPRHGRG